MSKSNKRKCECVIFGIFTDDNVGIREILRMRIKSVDTLLCICSQVLQNLALHKLSSYKLSSLSLSIFHVYDINAYNGTIKI